MQRLIARLGQSTSVCLFLSLLAGAAVAQQDWPELRTGEAEAIGTVRATLQGRIEKFRFRSGPRVELTSDREFRGGEVVDDGRIVLVPRRGTHVGEFDPRTGRFERTAKHGQAGGFGFGALLDDGHTIVMAPRGSRNVGLYDAKTRRYTDGPAHGQASDNAFLGSVKVRDDLIVFAPLNARVVGLYNPRTNTYRDGPKVPEPGHYLFSGIIDDPASGKVIFTPFDSPHVGIYDPETDRYISGPAHQAGKTNAYSGVTRLADGTLLMAPRNADRIGLYDPQHNTFTQGPPHGEGAGAFMAAATWPSGEVIMAPFKSDHIGIYDPKTGEYRSGPSVKHVEVLESGQRFSGAILTQTGDQLIMPNRAAKSIGLIEATRFFDEVRGDATRFFEYRPAGSAHAWQATVPVAAASPGPMEALVKGLRPDTVYEFRPVLEVQGEKHFGPTRRFETRP